MAKLVPPNDLAEEQRNPLRTDAAVGTGHGFDHDDHAAELHEHLEAKRRIRGFFSRKRASGWRRCIVSLTIMLMLVTGAIGGGLYWRLGHGPLEVPFLADYTLRVIAGKLPPGFGAELGNVQFERRDGRLTVILDDLVLRGSDGNALVTAP